MEEEYKKLSIFDTLHDFYKERKKVQSADNDDDIDETRITFIRNIVLEVISNALGAAVPSSAEDILAHLTDGKIVSALSHFEQNVVAYFEQNLSLSLSVSSFLREEISYREILDLKQNKEELFARFQNSRNINDILVIHEGDESFGQLGREDRTFLSDFILHYMLGTSSGHPRFMFDGKTGILSKLFADIEQTKAILVPQTIADSAPTSLRSFNGRVEMYFPSKENSVPVTSNIYTRNAYSILFQNDGFSRLNPYKFHLEFKKENVQNAVANVYFSSTETDGPSVNYIINLLSALQTDDILSNVPRPKTNMVNLGNAFQQNPLFRENLQTKEGSAETGKSLLLDIKRLGDHEQVNASIQIRETMFPQTILCTIDHLCSLFARIRRQPCIFHVGEKLILFRFDTTSAVDPHLTFMKTTLYISQQAKEFIQKLKLLETLVQMEDFEKQKEELARAVLSEFPQEPFQESFTFLLRERMRDFEEQFEYFTTKWAEFSAPFAMLVPMEALVRDIQADADITPHEFYDKYSTAELHKEFATIKKHYADILTLLSQFHVSTQYVRTMEETEHTQPRNPIVLFKVLTKKNKFAKNVSHKIFNYASNPFFHLHKIINVFYTYQQRILYSTRPVRGSIDVFEKLKQLSFHDTLDTISSQFFNKERGEQIRELLHLDIDILSTDSSDEKKRKFFQNLETFRAKTAPLVGGGRELLGPKQQSMREFRKSRNRQTMKTVKQSKIRRMENIGKKRILTYFAPPYYLELHDLFYQVCTLAHEYITSIFSEMYPKQTLLLLLQEIRADLTSYLSVPVGGDSPHNGMTILGKVQTALAIHMPDDVRKQLHLFQREVYEGGGALTKEMIQYITNLISPMVKANACCLSIAEFSAAIQSYENESRIMTDIAFLWEAETFLLSEVESSAARFFRTLLSLQTNADRSSVVVSSFLYEAEHVSPHIITTLSSLFQSEKIEINVLLLLALFYDTMNTSNISIFTAFNIPVSYQSLRTDADWEHLVQSFEAARRNDDVRMDSIREEVTPKKGPSMNEVRMHNTPVRPPGGNMYGGRPRNTTQKRTSSRLRNTRRKR